MAKLPAGPVPLHKSMAAGSSKKEAESKALERTSGTPSKR